MMKNNYQNSGVADRIQLICCRHGGIVALALMSIFLLSCDDSKARRAALVAAIDDEFIDQLDRMQGAGFQASWALGVYRAKEYLGNIEKYKDSPPIIVSAAIAPAYSSAYLHLYAINPSTRWGEIIVAWNKGGEIEMFRHRLSIPRTIMAPFLIPCSFDEDGNVGSLDLDQMLLPGGQRLWVAVSDEAGRISEFVEIVVVSNGDQDGTQDAHCSP